MQKMHQLGQHHTDALQVTINQSLYSFIHQMVDKEKKKEKGKQYVPYKKLDYDLTKHT